MLARLEQASGSAALDAAREVRRPHRAPGAPAAPAPSSRAAPSAPDPGVLARLEIPRLRLSAIVREGTSEKTLRVAVGHIAGTPRPGELGNVGLAAHRDTFFRPLRSVREGDEIRLVTASDVLVYRVVSTRVVGPAATEVLANDGTSSLTLVTCWPFGWIGRAPERFVVRARRKG